MDTQQCVVQVWKTENRIASNGPDYNMPIVAYTEVDALKKVLHEKEESNLAPGGMIVYTRSCEEIYYESRFPGS